MRWIHRRILSDFKDLQLILTLVKRRKTDDTLPSSSDASVISWQSQTKEQESYKPISLINKDSVRYLQTDIYQKDFYDDQVDFIPEMQG